MLQVVIVAKALVEIFLFVLLGQAVLRLLAGSACHSNPIYAFFSASTRPLWAPFRKLLPARQAQGMLPVALGCLSLLAAWVLLVAAKIHYVLGVR
ncbi:MAG: YggT family protein [Rhodocyclaceae bacterium]|nr:YggT family protein [Rhodocyclaceae bacterium]MBX3667067.1 YggT family protein [Rhodocyclaceae bacterium]